MKGEGAITCTTDENSPTSLPRCKICLGSHNYHSTPSILPFVKRKQWRWRGQLLSPPSTLLEVVSYTTILLLLTQKAHKTTTEQQPIGVVWQIVGQGEVMGRHGVAPPLPKFPSHCWGQSNCFCQPCEWVCPGSESSNGIANGVGCKPGRTQVRFPTQLWCSLNTLRPVTQIDSRYKLYTVRQYNSDLFHFGLQMCSYIVNPFPWNSTNKQHCRKGLARTFP